MGARNVDAARALALAVMVPLVVAGAPFTGAAQRGTPQPASPAATPMALDALLASCPYESVPIPGVAGHFAEWGLGGAPAWLVGWGVPPLPNRTVSTDPLGDGTAERPYLTPGAQERELGITADGWIQKGLWIVETDAPGPVTVRGVRRGDGLPLRVSVAGEAVVTELVLDPRDPAIPFQRPGWSEFPSYIYFPATGCYELTAEWPGGGWRTTIPFVAPEDAPGAATPDAHHGPYGSSARPS